MMKCSECGFLRVISVPDWFQCALTGNEKSTQTELNKSCVLCDLDCKHKEFIFEGSNICANCGALVIKKEE